MSIDIMALGVAAPIPNCKFSEGTYFEATVDDTAIGDTTLVLTLKYYPQKTLSSVYSFYAEYFLMAGDLIELGPSSNSNYQGFSEIVTVQSVSYNTVTLTAGTNYPYNSGDTVKGTGRGLAGGWARSWFTGLGINNYPPKPYTVPHQLNDYLDHMSYQKVSHIGGSSGITRTAYLATELANMSDHLYRPIMENTYYRVGLYYKVTGPQIFDPNSALPNTLSVHLFNGSSSVVYENIINFLNHSQLDLTTWHFFTSTGYSSSFTDYYGSPKIFISLLLATESGQAAQTANLSLNSLFVEHAKLSDGDTQGVYWFTSDGTQSGTPIVPNIDKKWQIIKSQQSAELGEGFKQKYNVRGIGYKRWRVDLDFTWFPESFLKNLDVFLDWQRRGHKLILHTGEDHLTTSTFGISDQMVNDSGLPAFLIGELQVNGSNRPLNDMTVKNLTFTFIESPYGFVNKRY